MKLTSSSEERLEAGIHAETPKNTVKTNSIKSDLSLMKRTTERKEEREMKGEREGKRKREYRSRLEEIKSENCVDM